MGIVLIEIFGTLTLMKPVTETREFSEEIRSEQVNTENIPNNNKT